jgi:hypothetical protein
VVNGGKSVSSKQRTSKGKSEQAAPGKSLVDDRKALRKVIERAQDGDESVLPDLRKALKEEPKISSIFVNLANSLERSIIRNMASGDLMVEECMPRNLEEMRKELAGESPSSLERLLVERIVVCWLEIQYFELIYAQNTGNLSLAQSEFHQKRIDKIHRRYLSSIRTLAQIRKMGPAVQINIAEKQINTAS